MVPTSRIVIALAGLGALAAGPREPEARVQREAWVMGTRLRLEVRNADRSAALAAAEAAIREVERLDRLLSTWDPASEMSVLNAAPPGAPSAPSPELLSLLGEAERWAARTDRAFEPAVGALVDAWDLRGAGRVPSVRELADARAATGPSGLTVRSERGVVVRHAPAAWIDTGGFGKGAALRAAADTLRSLGVDGALLDLGGQVIAIGGGAGREGAWTVRVAHPAGRHEAVATLRLTDASVATSGTSERWIRVDGRRIGHILDPRTGMPVPAWGSVSVVSADALVADALATALYVMGPEAGMAWASGRTDVGVLFLEVGEDGLRARWNEAMDRWMVSAPPGAMPHQDTN